MAIQNHTPEAAAASHKDSQGRTNYKVPHYIASAEVTAMAARAGADDDLVNGTTGSTATLTKAV